MTPPCGRCNNVDIILTHVTSLASTNTAVPHRVVYITTLRADSTLGFVVSKSELKVGVARPDHPAQPQGWFDPWRRAGDHLGVRARIGQQVQETVHKGTANFDIILAVPRAFLSSILPPTRRVTCSPYVVSVLDNRMLIGACNPMLCNPIHVFRCSCRSSTA